MPDRPIQNLPQQGRKWLKGVAPDDPVSAAAAIAVSARLEYVAACLPPAAFPKEKDDGQRAVHQLRVGSRRAAAALAAFVSCLPKRRNKSMKRRLRKIRRAAGAARDLDVLMVQIDDSERGLSAGDVDEIVGYLATRRADAQPALIAAARKLPTDRFERKISRLVRRIRWRGDGSEPTISAFAEKQMREVAEEFSDAAQAITRHSSVEALHTLRIAAKRLRYTIELFACAADGGLRRGVYPLVEDLQERLGAMNDHASAERYFRTFAQQAPSTNLEGKFNRLAEQELQATDAAIESFHGWWNPDRLDEIYSGAVNAFQSPTAA